MIQPFKTLKVSIKQIFQQNIQFRLLLQLLEVTTITSSNFQFSTNPHAVGDPVISNYHCRD